MNERLRIATLLGLTTLVYGNTLLNGFTLDDYLCIFNNPAVTTPFLDLEATTHVRDYEITLSLSGEIDKPKVNGAAG